MTVALAIPEITLGAQNFKIGHMTLTPPLLKVICPPYAGTWYSRPIYRIWSL